jgi:hypothetical protein
MKYKIIAYIVVWALAFYFVDFSFGGWPLAYLFPLGLIAVFNRHLANDGGWGIFAACYVVYLAHAWFYFRSRSAQSTLVWFAILIVLLVGDVAGCRQMIHPH